MMYNMLNSSVLDGFKCSFNEIAEKIIELARTRKRKDQAEMEAFLNVLDNNSKDENTENTVRKKKYCYNIKNKLVLKNFLTR